MMQPKTRTEELLRQLGTSVIPVEEPERMAARRDRIVPRLEQLIHQLPARRRERRWVRVAIIAASAAAMAAVAVGYRWRASPPSDRAAPAGAARAGLLALAGSVQVVHQASETLAPPHHRVEVDTSDEVTTGQGAHARATLPSGAEIDIGPESKIRLAGARAEEKGRSSSTEVAEVVVLSRGSVAVRVPKLGPARTFSVETPEAAVVVHGTVFSVERHPGGVDESPRTSVGVEEGSVAVRHHGLEVLLQAGDQWSSTALPPEASDGRPAPPNPSFGKERQAPGVVTSRNAATSPRASALGEAKQSDKSSSLAAENQLLKAAMAARQQGNLRRAVQLAGELLARYPGSPLVEEARVERLRALSAAGLAGAETEARAYLADYPQGFARQEAARILANLPR